MKTVHKKLFNLFLFGVIGALAVGLLLRTLNRKEEKQVETKKAKRILPLGMQVRAITLTTPDDTFELEKRGESWHLLTPLETPAEQSTIEGMIKHLLALEQVHEVGTKKPDGAIEPPADLWLFALEPPRYAVTLTPTTGDPITVRVGKKNSFDGSVYLKREDRPVVLQVDGALEYQVSKNLYQLRDKRLVDVSADEVTRLAVYPNDGEPWAVEKDGDDWLVVEPQRLVADRTQVTGMLSALSNVRATEFVSEKATAEERARFGLNEPTVRVVLTAGDTSHELLLSRQQQGTDAVHFAMRAGEHPILMLGSDWVLNKINIGLNTLRDKHVLRFNRDRVRSLVLTRGDSRLAFDKSQKPGGGDTWRMTAPEAGDADDATLAGILYRLSSLEAKSVVAEKATEEKLEKAGLVEPELSIEVLAEEGSLAVARFSTERDGERLATDGQQIALIDAATINDLSLDPNDYREQPSPE